MKNINKKNPERFDPDDNSFLEETRNHHFARYSFASLYLKENYNVLDLCCGTGYGSNLLKQKDTNIIGVDIDESSINLAKIKYPNCSFFCKDICLDYPNYLSFDLITFFEAIEHLKFEDGVNIINNISNHSLKKGGILILSTPRDINKNNHFHISEWSIELIKPILEEKFSSVQLFGQSWKTGQINTNYKDINDFYIYVCEK